MHRKITVLCFLIFSMLGYTQSTIQPRLYIGVEALNKKLFFNDEGYYGITIGAEILKFKFIAPEVEVGFYGGVIDKQEQLDVSNLPDGYQGPAPKAQSYITGGFNTLVYSFSPKLIFGDKKIAFIILPKYSFSNVDSYLNKYELTPNGNEYIRNQREELDSSQSFLSLGFGIEGSVFETEKLALSFMMQYSFFDTRSAFKGFDFNGFENNQGTRAIGVGFRLYFAPFANAKPNF